MGSYFSTTTAMPAEKGPSLEEVLRGVLPEKLDQPCQDKHLCEVARDVADWPSLAPLLGINQTQMQQIRVMWPHSVIGQNTELLRTWKGQLGSKGTYRGLCKALMEAQNTALVEKVCKILCASSSDHEEGGDEFFDALEYLHPPIPDKNEKEMDETPLTLPYKPYTRWHPLGSLAHYLRMTYKTHRPKFAVLQWPPPPTEKVFNLSLIKSRDRRQSLDVHVRLKLEGKVSHIMKRNKSVQLEDLFKSVNKKRRVILIEGAPGAGKSSLAWEICQKWEARELFHQEFKVVIHVQLGDLEVQAAKEIADLLPFKQQSKEQKDAASSIEDCYGEGVLFVLDGWDEYSPGLQDGSLFEKLICNPIKLGVQFSTVLITSRPIASATLYQIATSQIEIVGFTPGEISRYFENVFDDIQIAQKLLDHLRHRPVIKASCYLPLNAAIVAHLFIELDHALPTTLHDVFYSLVLSCIIRHLNKGRKTKTKVTSLGDLPSNVQEDFQKVCILAYMGTRENKVIFSGQELRSYGVPEDNVLGLMQVVQRLAISRCSEPTSYHFLHLAIQELLAALHISKLPPDEQVRIFTELFDKPRFQNVFHFYAAFTKLKTEGINDIVAQILHRAEKRPLLSLIHCLFEAQDVPLCHFVSSELKGILNLSELTLSPLDILAMKYFLTCVNVSRPTLAGSTYSDVSLPKLVLSNCDLKLEDIGSIPLRELVELRELDLANNPIGANGIGYIANEVCENKTLEKLSLWVCSLELAERNIPGLVKMLSRNRMLKELNLSWNSLGANGLCCIEALGKNTGLVKLSLQKCSLEVTAVSGPQVEKGLSQNKTLRELDLGMNPLHAPGIRYIASGLRHNEGLEKLSLRRCSGLRVIEDSGALDMLQRMLCDNTTLKELDLSETHIGAAGLDYLAKGMTMNKAIVKLVLQRCSLAVTEDNGPSLGHMLHENTTLEELILAANSVNEFGLGYIARGLRHNSTLLKLSLRSCGLEITNATRQVILGMLKDNSSLEELNLSDNEISDEGLMIVGEGLTSNEHLKTLNLYKLHHVSSMAWRQFVSQLKGNRGLTKLYMWIEYDVVVQETREINLERKRHCPPLPPLEVD